MKLGFVGVGKHAQCMAAAFRECGAVVVAHDRAQSGAPLLPNGFGSRMAWRDMIDSRDVDAIACCAPPAVTLDVLLECAQHAKRCCATKPLLATSIRDNCDMYVVRQLDVGEIDWTGLSSLRHLYTRNLYVDLWRLYSPSWQALKADLTGRELISVNVDFYGNGPVRKTHSGLLDYGPHALAFVLDLGLRPELEWRISEEDTYKGLSRRWHGASREPNVQINTGNGFGDSAMRVRVETSGGPLIWHEKEGVQSYLGSTDFVPVMTNHRLLALRNFCRDFVAGKSSDTLRISCDAMRILRDTEQAVDDRAVGVAR